MPYVTNQDDWDNLKENVMVAPNPFPLVRGDGAHQATRFGSSGSANQPVDVGGYARTIPDNRLGFDHETFTGISNASSFTFECWFSINILSYYAGWYCGYLNQGRNAPAFVISSGPNQDNPSASTELQVRWYTSPDDGGQHHTFSHNMLNNPKTPEKAAFVPDPHHLVVTSEGLTRNSWGIQKVYIDGTLVGTVDLTGEFAVSAGDFYVGFPLFGEYTPGHYADGQTSAPKDPVDGLYNERYPEWGQPYGTALGHVAMYDKHVFTEYEVYKHYAAGATAWYGDPEGVRMTRILDYAGWPPTMQDITFGDSQLLGSDWEEGTTALQALQDAETDGGGTLFMTGEGKVAYRGRLSRVGASVKAHFACDTSTAPTPPLSWSTDSSRVVNKIKATRDADGGLTTTVIDHPSVDEYGELVDDQFSLRVVDDKEVIERARQKLKRYSQPDVRVSQLVLKPTEDEELWDLALSLEIGDLISLDELPDHAPDDSLKYFVESVQDAFTVDGSRLLATFTFDLSPAAPWLTWTDPEDITDVPDESTGDGGLDAPPDVTAASAEATDTTVTVVWSEPGDAVPLSVVVADATADADSVTTTWENPSA